MQTIDDVTTGTDEPSDPPAEQAELRRSTTKRLVAGVAGGISERFDVDVNLVRVGFVVLACLWGLGAAVYVAMWALVPSADQRGDGAEGTVDAPRRSSWFAALLLAGVVCFGLVVSTHWWAGPGIGSGISLGWLLLIGVLVLIALRRPTGRLSLGRVLAVVLVGLVSLAIVAVGAFFAVVAMTGVPLSGGIGDRVWQPTSPAQVQHTYRTAIGAMTVDLRQVSFRQRTVRLTASVGVGTLLVEVPSDVVVDVSAHSGVGTVVYLNGSRRAFSEPKGAVSGTATQLVLTAEAGVGIVRLYRGG